MLQPARSSDGQAQDEMARYIDAAFQGFEEILGEIHPESYIYVQEVRGFAYGFGGYTQEHRYIANKLSQSTEVARSISRASLSRTPALDNSKRNQNSCVI